MLGFDIEKCGYNTTLDVIFEIKLSFLGGSAAFLPRVEDKKKRCLRPA